MRSLFTNHGLWFFALEIWTNAPFKCCFARVGWPAWQFPIIAICFQWGERSVEISKNAKQSWTRPDMCVFASTVNPWIYTGISVGLNLLWRCKLVAWLAVLVHFPKILESFPVSLIYFPVCGAGLSLLGFLTPSVRSRLVAEPVWRPTANGSHCRTAILTKDAQENTTIHFSTMTSIGLISSELMKEVDVFEDQRSAPTWHSVDGSQWSQHANRPHCRKADALQVEWILQHPGKYIGKKKQKKNTFRRSSYKLCTSSLSAAHTAWE